MRGRGRGSGSVGTWAKDTHGQGPQGIFALGWYTPDNTDVVDVQRDTAPLAVVV